MSFVDSIQVIELNDEQHTKLPQQLLSKETQGFDYAVLTPEVQVIVQSRTSELKNLMRRSVQNIIDIGQKLIEVKEKLGHGHFRPWLKAEFDWSVRTAARFMQVASEFKCVNLAHLNIAASALYLLAKPSTLEEARKEALQLAREGENLTYSKAKAIIGRYQKQSQPNASKPREFIAIDTSAKATEENLSTSFDPCSLSPTCCQSQALEPKDKANSIVTIEPSIETVPAKQWDERLEQETVKTSDVLFREHPQVVVESQPELSNHIRVLGIEHQNPELVTNTAQTFQLTFAGIHIDFEGHPEALLILFEQMLSHPAFTKEVLQQARSLAALITNFN